MSSHPKESFSGREKNTISDTRTENDDFSFFVSSPPKLDELSFDGVFRNKYSPLAGTDEAGRGPLAGPVVAAAVILNPDEVYPGLGDSKKLSAQKREKAFELISQKALALAWAVIEAPEVDKLNPLVSALMAMKEAVNKLSLKPALVLVDGNQAPEIDIPLKLVVKGDAKSLSIGAASIVAKVVRDRLMLKWHQAYPQYGFDRHKGYGTAVHLEALRRHGPCPCHRFSFKGVGKRTELFSLF